MGRDSVYNSYRDWATNFPFWREDTIERAIRKLEERDLLHSWKKRARYGYHTKSYRVNSEAVLKVVSESRLPGRVSLSREAIPTRQTGCGMGPICAAHQAKTRSSKVPICPFLYVQRT